MMRRSIRSARREFPRPGPGLAAALVACLAGAALCGGEPEVPEVPSAELSRLSKQFDVKRVKRTVASLAALGSRVPGQPGNEKAVDFVLEALRDPALGLDKVGTQQFEMPAPVDKGSFIEVVPEGGGPRRIKLEPLWPNLIRTTSCRIPAEGDGTVPLIYVHGGQLSQYKGLPARGSVVLMDFNSGMRWLDAANLGAQAIIFVEPDEALRGEAEEKFLRSPLDMPRFWVSREVGRELVDLCERDGPKAIDCRVGSKVVWESTVVRNVYGLLKGTGDGLELEEDEAPELLLVGSHLDSMSVVPSLAPGAEGATGAAFLLELARIFARHPPKRDVLFLLTNSHYMHLKGMRHFYNLVNSDLDDYEKSIIQLNKEAGTSRAMAWVVERRPELDDPANRQVLRTMALQIIEEQGGFEKLPGADRWKYFLMAELIGCALFLGCLVAYCLVKRREGLQTSVLAGGLAIILGLLGLAVWGYFGHRGETWKESIIRDFIASVVEDADEELASWVGDKAARVEERLRTLRLIEALDPDEKKEKAELEDDLQLLWRVKDKIRGFARYTELEKKPERKKVVDALYDAKRAELAAELRRAAGNLDGQRAVLEHNRLLRGLFTVKERKSPDGEPEKVDRYGNIFYLGLDISSRSSRSGLLFKGMYFNQSTNNMERLFSDIGERANLHARRCEQALDLTEGSALVDAIRVVKGWTWDTFIPDNGKIGLDVEIVNSAGELGRIPWKGLCVVPVHDARLFVDTPHDTDDKINWQNLAHQGRFLSPFLKVFLDDPQIFESISLNDSTVGPVTVTGDVVRKGGARSVFADRPVPGALIVRIKSEKTFMGVRSSDISMTDRHGRFNLVNTRNRSRCDLEVYVLDDETGSITYAHDKGQTSTPAAGSFYVAIYRGVKTCRIPVFGCDPMAVLDLVDQRFLTQLSAFSIIDARSESAPQTFGAARPVLGEPVIIVFGKPDARFKIIVSKGQLGVRMALLNIDRKKARTTTDQLKDLKGAGFSVTEEKILPFSSYQAAWDMFLLDDWRISKLVEHSIENKRLHNPAYVKLAGTRKDPAAHKERPGLHDLTGMYLHRAEEALKRMEYDVFVEMSRSAWATESRAYPDVRGTQDDTVVGVIFYLFLVLPFCFFVERLIFGFVKIEHQILGFFGVFIAIFIVLRLVHPAFALTRAPTMVLLAFIILALSIIVIGIIYGKFSTELKALRETRRAAGQSSADVNRLSASAVAVSLGISNMRRRKIRTFLTTVTIIILTFTALSFTSVVTSIRKPRVELESSPAYTGMLIKDQAWAKLDEPVYRILRNRYDRLGSVVSPRAWYISQDPNKQTKISVVNPDEPDRVYTALGALGLSREEVRVFDDLSGTLHPGGKWFSSDSGLEVILSDEAVDKLGIPKEDARGKAVEFLGASFTIVGVVDTAKFDEVKDLNMEQITPVDWVAQDQPTQQGTAAAGVSRQMALVDAALGKTYEHHSVSRMAIIPYQTAMNLGAELRSVAIRFGPREDARAGIGEILGRMEMNIYASLGGKSYLYASLGGKSLSGLKNLIIPILIASLIIFNTMVGSVYERNREIHIFSSLGLAPGHIAALFLTESIVYATLGAMSGYLIGQAVAKVITALDMLQGLTLNYSSLSTVSTTMIVMLAVVGSTIYPAIQAARVAVPSAERRWGVPEPNGDEIILELPFTFPHEHLFGINQFMYEFFSAHIEATVGRFYAREISVGIVETPLGEGYCLYFMAWLTPYDLGVSQEVQIYTVPTSEGNYVIELALYRASGYVSSWVRTNLPFLNTLRKQFLMWRTLTNEQRDGLEADGRGMLRAMMGREVAVPEEFAAQAAAVGEAPGGGATEAPEGDREASESGA